MNKNTGYTKLGTVVKYWSSDYQSKTFDYFGTYTFFKRDNFMPVQEGEYLKIWKIQ